MTRPALPVSQIIPGAPVFWQLGHGAPPSGNFTALVPGAQVPLMSVTLPGGLPAQARLDVARRQICDRLGRNASDLDIRPFAPPPRTGFAKISVTTPQEITQWRAALGGVSGRCVGLLPDYFALPAHPDIWVIEQSSETIRARLGTADGFTAEPALAQEMLRLALQVEGARPQKVLLCGAPDPARDALFDGIPIARDLAGLGDGFIPRYLAHDERSLDLLHAAQSAPAGMARQLRRALVPLGLCLLGAGAWSTALHLETQRNETLATDLRRETRVAAQRDLLGSVPIIDLRAQVTRAMTQAQDEAQALSTQGQTDAPLDLIARAADVLTGRGSVEMLSFAPRSQGVSFDLQLPSFAALDDAQTALVAAGLVVEVTRSAAQDGGVSAQINVSGGGS